MVLASVAMGVLRAAMSFWAGTGGAVPLEQLTDAAFQALADGFPENGALHGLTWSQARARQRGDSGLRHKRAAVPMRLPAGCAGEQCVN